MHACLSISLPILMVQGAFTHFLQNQSFHHLSSLLSAVLVGSTAVYNLLQNSQFTLREPNLPHFHYLARLLLYPSLCCSAAVRVSCWAGVSHRLSIWWTLFVDIMENYFTCLKLLFSLTLLVNKSTIVARRFVTFEGVIRHLSTFILSYKTETFKGIPLKTYSSTKGLRNQREITWFTPAPSK